MQQAHSQFVQERGSTTSGRESKMCQLAAAHDAFRDLLNNLKEVTKFYNDLTQLLVAFQNKVSDYCLARKTEKEELLKDLTQESSRQAPLPAPTQPSYHTDPGILVTLDILKTNRKSQFVDVKKEVPPRPPQPSQPPQAPQAPGGVPYPVYVQGMPVPYGASASTPYPAYVPPPMPQGYNPYGTMPYPSSRKVPC